MTSRWGPLGWMTLHSISINYPDSPSAIDKSMARRYLDLFRDTITCPSCKNHFTSMFRTYQLQHPEWLDSKLNFILAICRMHNTVNKRLDKPIQHTFADCIGTLVAATTITSPSVYRNSYHQYLLSNWGQTMDGEGRIHAGYVREMIRINTEYWSPRETKYIDIPIVDADVVTTVPQDPALYRVGNGIPVHVTNPQKVGFRITGGRLKLGGK